jgi:hypothetical protein
MSHRVKIGGLAGQVPGEAVTRLNDIIATSQRMDEKVAKRIGMSVEDYQKLIYDELWLDGEAAVKQRHADRVAQTREESFETMFGSVEAVFSKCPLIAGPVKLGFDRSKFRSYDEALSAIRKTKRNITTQF